MAWVAIDRGIRNAETLNVDGPLDRWRALRARIHHDVCTHGFNRERNAFVQWYGSWQLDASLLLLPTTGFLPASDSRVRGTIAAIERELLVDGFVLRYDTSHTDDGLPPGEGAFLACTFWLADAYAVTGRHREARALFERLLSLRTDLGLLSEEYDVGARRLVGNFPQAFSHIALLTSAHNLARIEKPAEQRAS
jgi:GH15 family glucan-1,4-alpha-glucosidase